MQTGIYRDLSPDDYYSHPAISKSGLDLVRKAPALFKHHQGEERVPTDAMRFGQIYHVAVLEHARFVAEVVAEPSDAPKRPSITQLQAANPSQKTRDTIAYWNEFDAANASKTVISADENRQVFAMREALLSNKACRKLIEKIQEFESSIFWTDPRTGLSIRSRLDGISSGIIVDLKSTEDASPEAFSRSIFNRRYHVQAPLYSDGFEAATREKPKAFAFIAQEKSAPYLSAIYVADKDMMDFGREEYREDLDTYAECMRSDIWPGYPEKAVPISLPAWAMKARAA